MKKFAIFLMLIIPSMSFCQMNEKTASKIKSSKLLIELSEIEEVDSNLIKAINNYWNFNENYIFNKPNKNTNDKPKMALVLSTLIAKEKFNNMTISRYELGNAFILRISSGKKFQHTGFNKYSELSYYDFVETIKRAQFVMSEIIKEGSWGKVFKSTKKKYGKELKNKTLLVDDRLLKENLTIEKFKSIYPYDFKFVKSEEIEKAVLENDESKAYISIVEEKVGLYVQYLCNAGDGKIYTHKHSVLQSNSSRANKTFNRYLGIGDLKDLSRRIK